MTFVATAAAFVAAAFVLAAAYVTMSIMRFVPLEILGWDRMLWGGFFTVIWHWSGVAVLGVVVIIYLSVKVSRTMKPGARADEGTATEPLGAVIAVWSAAVWSGLIVAIGAIRRYADVDGDLSLGFRSSDCNEEPGDSRSDEFRAVHKITSA
jgi:hypothetical protein